MDITTIFYHTDEFCKLFEKQISKHLLSSGNAQRNRTMRLSLSEVMTISIYYHYSGYKTFKDYYLKNELELKAAFPNFVSYSRFIELKSKAVKPLALFLRMNGIADCTGISFIDSFSMKACHIKREHSHKVLKGLAQKGKTSVGWFYGTKVHLIINHNAELVDFYITGGNTVDNNLKVIERMTKNIYGKIFGDKGYLLNNDLVDLLAAKNVNFITKSRKNMKAKKLAAEDQQLLKKRGIIESVIGILKEGFSIEHTRHRSPMGFLGNICSSLIAYAFRMKKPSISFDSNLLNSIA